MEKHFTITYVTKVFQSAGHNDETAEKSLLCVKEGGMKLNARFIGIMGLLFGVPSRFNTWLRSLPHNNMLGRSDRK